MKRKLFIWRNVLFDRTEGIFFAIAKNKEEAIESLAISYYNETREMMTRQYKRKDDKNSKKLRNEFNTLEEYLFSLGLENTDTSLSFIQRELSFGTLEIHELNKNYGTYLMG